MPKAKPLNWIVRTNINQGLLMKGKKPNASNLIGNTRIIRGQFYNYNLECVEEEGEYWLVLTFQPQTSSNFPSSLTFKLNGEEPDIIDQERMQIKWKVSDFDNEISIGVN